MTNTFINIKSMFLDSPITTDATNRTTDKDIASFFSNVSSTSMSYIDYASFPKLYATFVGPINRREIATTYTDLRNDFSEIITKYRYIKARPYYVFSLKSSYGQTGCLGIYWTPYSEASTYDFVYGAKPLTMPLDLFYALPDACKLEMRIGQDSTAYMDLPWVKETSAFEDRSGFTTALPGVREDDYPLITVGEIFETRSVASGPQDYTLRIYRGWTDIELGGFIGSNAPPVT